MGVCVLMKMILAVAGPVRELRGAVRVGTGAFGGHGVDHAAAVRALPGACAAKVQQQCGGEVPEAGRPEPGRDARARHPRAPELAPHAPPAPGPPLSPPLSACLQIIYCDCCTPDPDEEGSAALHFSSIIVMLVAVL